MARVCLVMIVKNEAARLKRCLDSFLPHVDCAYIVDTGSTDDTKAVANDILMAWGKSFGLVDRPFDNFSSARNAALVAAGAAWPSVDYTLMLDADMVLTGENLGNLRACTKDLGMIEVADQEASRYWLPLLRRVDCDVWYTGRTHETCQMTAGRYENVVGPLLLHHGDGGSRADKFERDLALLYQDAQDDPFSTRTAFYIAQTLHCLGRFDEAAEAFRARVAMGGWDEEVFCAQLQLARCLWEGGKKAPAILEALDAYERRPTRAEPLADLARWLGEIGRVQSAGIFAVATELVTWPCKDILFVEPAAWSIGPRRRYFAAVAEKFWGSALASALDCIRLGDTVFGHSAAAKALWELGKREEAISHAEQGLVLAPGDARIANDIAVMKKAVNAGITSD